MLGHIFTILGDMIEETYGLPFWNEVLVDSDLPNEGVFTAGGLYPDEYMFTIVNTLSAKLNTPINDLLKAYGQYIFKPLYNFHPELIDCYSHPKEMLMRLEDRIHLEVSKYHQHAALPMFDTEDIAEDRLRMYYFSKRKLCPLVEGVYQGVADHFSCQIDVEHSTCVHRGDDKCTFELHFL